MRLWRQVCQQVLVDEVGLANGQKIKSDTREGHRGEEEALKGHNLDKRLASDDMCKCI
jgi:hypothetical protein